MANATMTCGASKGGEEITYGFEGLGSERKLIVSYSRLVPAYAREPGTSFREAKFEKNGRDIDVLFSLNRTRGLESMKPLKEEVEVPLPDEVYFVPKGHKMERRRLNVYTQLDDKKPKLRCRKELKYDYVPVRRCWFDRILDYFNLNKRAEPPNPHPVPSDW